MALLCGLFGSPAFVCVFVFVGICLHACLFLGMGCVFVVLVADFTAVVRGMAHVVCLLC